MDSFGFMGSLCSGRVPGAKPLPAGQGGARPRSFGAPPQTFAPGIHPLHKPEKTKVKTFRQLKKITVKKS